MNQQQLQEALIEEAINGQTQIEATNLRVINPSESLPVGIGPHADQPFFSGKSQNVRSTWVEQGWGHDSQVWPTYPFSAGDNPARVRGRMTSLSEASRENFGLTAWVAAQGGEAPRQGFWKQFRRSGAGAHGAVVSIPDPVPYTDQVPTYGGGAQPHLGVDYGLEALYGV